MTYCKAGGVSALGLILATFSTDMAWAQDHTLKIGGRLMVDYTLADLDGPDSTINDSEVRRARFFASGNYGKNIKYKFEINKESDDPVEVTDAYIQFTPNKSPFKIKVGQFKTHNSLEEEASSRFMSTLERSAFTDAFSLNRRLGVSVGTSGSNYSLNVGAYTRNVNEPTGGDEGHAFAARGTYNPIKTDDTIVHLGASWRYRSVGEDGSDFRYRQRPYTHVAPSRIVDTGRFADSDNLYAGEALVMHKNFWAAGEYATLSANGSGVNADADFSGGYAEAGVMFGGKRTYKGAKYNRPVVDRPLGDGGMGALALVARYDTLDLDDGPYTGQLDTIVLGADWWPTDHTRIGLNYFNVDAEDGSSEGGSGIVTRLSFDF